MMVSAPRGCCRCGGRSRKWPTWSCVRRTPNRAPRATRSVWPRRPDLVVSGINHGLNLAGDVFYSGTVAAAREAALRGFRGLALSAGPAADLAAAAACGVGLVASFLAEPLPRAGAGVLLNVNFPPGDRWSIRATRL